MKDTIQLKNDSDKKLSLEDLLIKEAISRNMRIEIFKKELALISGKPLKRNDKVQAGQAVELLIEDEDVGYEPVDLDLEVVYEDPDCLVINKPHGLCMHSYSEQVSLTNGIAYLYKERGLKRKVRFVSRLDRDTRGLVMIAKNPYTQSFMQEGALLNKKYVCLLEAWPYTDELDLSIKLAQDPLSKRYIRDGENGKINESRFHHLGKRENFELVEVELLTGRTHQIRASLAALGLPIVGDELYGSRIRRPKGQALMANYMEFYQMRGGEKVRLSLGIDEL